MPGRRADTIDIKDFGQIFAGSVFPVVMALLLPTKVLPNPVVGLVAFMVIILATVIAIYSYFSPGTSFGLMLKHLFLAFLIAAPFTALLTYLIDGTTLAQMTSWDIFGTTTILALGLGISGGAITDSVKS